MIKPLFEKYEISSFGIVYNKKNKKQISTFIDDNRRKRYERVRIHLTVSKGNRKAFYLHKLVLQEFKPMYNDKTDEIEFIDGNFKNCSLDNLRIIKDKHIIDMPNEETNKFFNQQNVYGMIKHFLSKYIYRYKKIDYNNVFGHEDLVQYLITYIHRKTPIYLIRYKDKQEYSTFVYKLLKTVFKSEAYHEINKHKSIKALKQNTFDHELNNSFIRFAEAYQLDILHKRK